MNFDYIRMLTYIEIKDFVVDVLTKKFKTNVIVKLSNVKLDSRSQTVGFDAVGSNGINLKGQVVCTDFGCVMTISGANINQQINCGKEWAKNVYTILKSKDISSHSRMGEVYKADYNEHCQKIRDIKLAEAEKECEENLLR